MEEEIEKSESRSQRKLKDYYDTTVCEVHEKLLSQMEDRKGESASLEARFLDLEAKVIGAPSKPLSPSHPPVVS